MRMKSLHMQGFKSFGDKTEMYFDKQIIGVVGPNGCGKSNIVDAIRWVMGEQSAKGLRGNEMSDIIFNGTTERKKASFSEVSLVFDNADKTAPHPYTDCAEVMITRRLYRSGESEYLINKVSVRLKDITDLFLGTGSSARAYSIVAQGKVDQVVLAKPEDRRLLLEEAAGIAKYKVRRQAAERKMDATKTNLDRVHDIVQELERSARSLERQVEKAEKFRALQASLRHLDERIIASKVARFDHEAQITIQDLTKESAALETLTTALDSLEATIEALRLESLNLEKGSSSDYERLLKLKESFSEADKRIELAKQRCALLENQIRERTRDIERIHEKSLARAAATQASLADRDSLEREKLEKEAHLHSLKTVIEDFNRSIQVAETQIGDIRRRSEEQRLLVQKVAQERDFLLKEEKSKTADQERIRAQLVSLDDAERDLAHQEESGHAQLAALTLKLEGLEENLRLKTLEKEQTEAREANIRQEIQNLEKALTNFQAERKSLLTLEEHSVGYDPSARERQRETGLPLLMDLLKFEKPYEAAGAAFLAAFGQAFADSRALEALSEGQRVSALLAGGSHEIALSPTIESAESYPISLWSAVVADRKQEFLRPLLEAIEIIEDDSSFSDSRLQIRRGGALSWPLRSGVRLEIQGVLERRVTPHGRKDSLEALEGVIQQTQTSLEDAKGQLKTTLEFKESIVRELSDYQKFSKVLTGERAELSLKIAKLHTEREGQSRRRQDLRNELQRLSTLVEDFRRQIESLVFSEGTEDPQALELLQVQLNGLKRDKEAKDQEWLERRIELGALQDRLSRLMEEAIQAEMTQSEYAHNQSIFRQDIEHWSRDIEGEKLVIVEQEAHSEAAKVEIATLDIQLADARQKLNVIRSEIEQRDIERRESAKIKDSKQELVQQLELRRQSLKYEVEELSQIVHERYHCSLQEFLASVSEADLEHLRDATVLGAHEVEAQELREKLEKFGDVNLLALSEFEEIQKRLEFMNKQKEDLLKTLDALKSIIDRINTITEFRFRETFKAINHNFQILFPKLFGGGRAYMSLTNENDLLETGVEIFAEPPGKKVQSMSLLSGGEKALTSISLLFALFAYRPASFCILDEVDAPLDEVNTSRYNSIIKEMAHLSQFIVITHNKRTMEVAETLFGVTMQEPGVSQLVGVQLQEARAFAATA